MTLRHLILAGALVVGVFPAAAVSQTRSETVIIGELRQNQEALARLAAALGQLGDQVRALDKRVTDAETASLKGLADQRIQISALAGTVQTMREKLDDSALRMTQSTQEIAAVREGVRQLTDQVNILIGLLQPPAGTDPAAAGARPGIPTQQLPPSPAALMQTANADYGAGRYQLGIDGFKEVVKTFPNTSAAAQAQFYIGESYRAWNKSKEALTEYDKVIANYKDHDYARTAMYMKGIVHLELMKQPQQARTIWMRLMKEFPDSDQARLAKQALSRIK